MLRSWLRKKGSSETQGAKAPLGKASNSRVYHFFLKMKHSSELEGLLPWTAAAYRVGRIAIYGLSVVAFWLILGQTGLVPENLYSMVCLGIAVLCFIFAIPLSIIIGLDKLPQDLGISGTGTAALFCFAVTVMNLYLLFLIKPLIRWGLAKRRERLDQAARR